MQTLQTPCMFFLAAQYYEITRLLTLYVIIAHQSRRNVRARRWVRSHPGPRSAMKSLDSCRKGALAHCVQ